MLAIAALILLVVFQAIPQLQRSQQNNASRSDVGRMIAAINTFIVDNNGDPPGYRNGAWDSSQVAALADAKTILSLAGAKLTTNDVTTSCSPAGISTSGCPNGLSLVTGGSNAPGFTFGGYSCPAGGSSCGIPRSLDTTKGYQMQIVVNAICDLTGNNKNGATSDGARADSVALQYSLAMKTSGATISKAYCVNVN